MLILTFLLFSRVEKPVLDISKEKMSQMIIKERLSKRAVMKENGLRQVCLQQRKLAPSKTYVARVMTKSKSKTQTVTN